MQRHYHETVHYVIAGRRPQRDRGRQGAPGRRATSSTPRRGPGTGTTTTRPTSRSSSSPSRTPACCSLLGVTRRQSAGLVHRRRGPGPIQGGPVRPQGPLDERPARAHQHLGRARRRRPRAAPRRRTAGCAPGCCAPGPGPTWCCCTAPAATWRPTPATSPGSPRDFRVTAYDMVGHGWSDLPDRPYTIDVLVRPPDRADGRARHRPRRTCPASRSAAGSPPGPPPTSPDRVGRLVLNTPGNIANKPEVMARLVESTTAAVRDPSDETVRRRVEFLFHHTEMVTDELVNLRRAVYSRPGFLTRSATRWCCRTRRSARTSPGTRPGSARSPRRRCCCGPTTTRPAASTRPRCCSAGCPTPGLHVIDGRRPLAAVGEAGRVPARSTATSCYRSDAA